MSILRTRRRAGVRLFAAVALTSLAAMFGVQSALSPAQAATPRSGTTTSTQPTWEGCKPGWLCLYKHANWNSHSFHPDARYYHCAPPVNLNNWVTRHGSYINNQVGGVTSRFYAGKDGTGKLLRTSRSYPWYGGQINGWYRADFNFYPVNSIDVC
jgi:hypothetical protein